MVSADGYLGVSANSDAKAKAKAVGKALGDNAA
jgi:hypothetical protein